MTDRQMPARGSRAKGLNKAKPASRIDATGLVVTLKNEDGSRFKTFDLTHRDGTTELRQELAQCIARLNGPGGRWKSLVTAERSSHLVTHFLTWCSDIHVRTLRDLTPAHWDAYMLHVRECFPDVIGQTRNRRIAAVRLLLCEFPELRLETQKRIDGRFSEPVKPSVSSEFYTKKEYRRVRRAATGVVKAAAARIGPNWELALLPRDEVPEGDVTRWEALQDLLDGNLPRSGPHFAALGARLVGTYTDVAGESVRSVRNLKGRARETLFPNSYEGLAAMIALTCWTGENRSTVENRDRPSLAASIGYEETTILTSERDKPRRGAGHRFSTENVTSEGAKGRALLAIMAMTEPARELARRSRDAAAAKRPTHGGDSTVSPDKLILWVNNDGRLVGHMANYVYSLREAPWKPTGLELDFAKLHRTAITRILQRPMDNTPNTYYTEYLSKDPEHQALMQETAAKGIQNLFDTARKTVVEMLDAEDANRRGLTPDMTALQLTPVGVGCRDCHHNPRTGRPCDDPWLSCLGCSNAYATYDNLPTLMAVHDLLETQREGVDDAARWERRYQLAWARASVILQLIPGSVLEEARRHVTPELRLAVHAAVIGRKFDI